MMFLAAPRGAVLATLYCTLIIGALCAPTGAAQSSALEKWNAFLTKPTTKTHRSLSSTIQACVASKCSDDAVAGKENNFADFIKLLSLAEKGNHLAMDLAFQIRPLYKNAAAPSEDMDNSLGLAATREPTFFLRLIRKYHVSPYEFQDMVVQTSRESIDDLRAQREEWRDRIRSFSKVKDPTLLPLRQQAISYTKDYIKQYFYLPDDAGGR